MPTESAPRKRLPAEARRAQLLDVAAGLFADRGYARSTTAEIAKAAGVTEPVIYRHFESKRDLFVALVEQTAELTLSIWREKMQAAADPAERLAILLGSNPMTSLGDDEAVRYRIILQAITETGDAEIHKAVVSHFRAMHAFMESEVEAAQKARKVSGRVPADMIAWILIDIALGFGVLEAMGITGHHKSKDTSVVQVIGQILLPRRK